MPRSESEWQRWFERREGKPKRKKPAVKSGVTSLKAFVPRVVGERTFFDDGWKRSKILEHAEYRRRNPTPAEAELMSILNSLNDGVLRGKFVREHVISGKWIVDFFFPEIRLAIEVDGSFHLQGHQMRRDVLKDADCKRFDITVLRLRNAEVAGDRMHLTAKLRDAWRRALERKNSVVGLSADHYFRR